MMTLVHAGIVAYGFDNSFFMKALDEIAPFFDHITIVYGPFAGFDLPYIPAPAFITSKASSQKYTLIMTTLNERAEQNKQRDRYLLGVKTGDILFMIDSDFLPRGDAIQDTIDALRDSDSWDSALITQRLPSGEIDQKFIGAYRYREGWRHSTGQLMQDKDGILIASPNYRVECVDDAAFYWEHHRTSAGMAYRNAQRSMWARE